MRPPEFYEFEPLLSASDRGFDFEQLFDGIRPAEPADHDQAPKPNGKECRNAQEANAANHDHQAKAGHQNATEANDVEKLRHSKFSAGSVCTLMVNAAAGRGNASAAAPFRLAN
jgi:hypothetical protein